MEDLVASTTAMATARMRSIHTRCDPQPIFNDPWSERLVSATMLASAIAAQQSDAQNTLEGVPEEQLASMVDETLRSSAAYANVIVRARYTEDALNAAIARGISQYVLIGAGFDSYVLRIPQEAKHVAVIEIDHPATQSLKLQRIRECELEVPGNVNFVAADLATEGLAEALRRSAFDPSRPAFFAWLGVTMYLTREANIVTLKSIADSSAAGSELVCSYIDQKWFEPGAESFAASHEDLERTVRSFGEPFISGFHPESLAADLGDVGLVLEEDQSEIQLVERYDPAGVNGLNSIDRSHIARARVQGVIPT